MNNIKIMGEGTIGAGNYKKITIMGEGDILGDINVENISVLGNARSEKKIETNGLKVSGNFYAKDNIKIKDRLKVSGSATFNNTVDSDDIKISGDVKFKNGLSSKKIKVVGQCDVLGNCESERIIGRGQTNVEGLMTADHIDLKLFTHSYIKEIGGENIKISKGKNLFMFRGGRGRLSSEVIEGDNIELTNTTCKVVRGNNVVINSGCKIELIEYRDDLKVNNNSEVGKSIWRKN